MRICPLSASCAIAVTRPPRLSKSGSGIARSYHAKPRKASRRAPRACGWTIVARSAKGCAMKLGELASALGCELRGDAGIEISGVAAIEDAGPGTLTFLADRRLAAKLADTRAAAVLLSPDADDVGLPSLRAPHPYLAFIAAVELFHPPPPRPTPAIHPTAVVAASAQIAPGAWLGPHVTVGECVRIGRDAVLHARVTIYDDVTIGERF